MIITLGLLVCVHECVCVCLFKGFPGQHSLWIKGVGKLVQIYCLRQLCQIWQAQMVSLQMAGRYLRVSSLCNKRRVVHFHLSVYKPSVHLHKKKCPSTFTDDCCVHILTFPGCWISQLRAVKTDLILGSCGVKDKKSPAAADEEQAARPSESVSLFFFFFFFF